MSDKNSVENVYPNGERYKLVVGLIHSKDEKGRPKLITLIHDEQTINLAGGEEFVTLYLPAKMLRKNV